MAIPLAHDRVVVVGTAGHVDHGKSALVRALTGTDPDRLAEEKARGLTIDLGFAWRTLPSGTVLSLVDVPGHEDFIRNMLAGAGGVDAAILVIAADEGPMPQTREHLAILDLLGVHRGVVALTKADLVDADWLAMVADDVRGLIAGTGLAHAPVVPVSSTTGMGIDALVDALEAVLTEVPPAGAFQRPRLSVDRSFAVAGFGTVVTGTLRDGEIAPGDTVEILPPGIRVRVRGTQSHGRAVDRARPGTRTALNLVGVEAAAITRGMVVCHPGTYRPTRLFDGTLEVLADAAPVTHDLAVNVFHGAAEIAGHVRVIGRREIAPGASGAVQIRLAAPAVVAAGDRFVVRLPSPSRTVGGGTVLDPHPGVRRRRFRPTVVDRFDDLATRDPAVVVWHMLAEREPCRAERLEATDLGIEPDVRDATLANLAAAGRVLALGDQWITDAGWQTLRQRIERILSRYHARYPLRVGPPLEALREQANLPAAAFGAVIERAVVEGWLARRGDTLHLPTHAVRFSAEEASGVADLMARYRDEPFKGPSRKDAEAAVGAAVLGALIACGDLVPVGPDVLFDRPAYTALRDGVLAHLDARGTITVADLRDRFETSRKYALAVLEHFDRLRITRRVGDLRMRFGAPATVAAAASPPVGGGDGGAKEDGRA
ncbi:selenocysteine-specific translation elongation factor [bacterium]|nr:MAG: selenocysteine-specific translation elongation factor [bacterium]